MSNLARKIARRVSKILTCDKEGCECRAEVRAVLMLAPSRSEQSVPHPLGFVLCPKHQADWTSAEQLLTELGEGALGDPDGLWLAIVAGLAPSGRVPLRELTQLAWEPCGPVHPEVIRRGAANVRAAMTPADEIHKAQREEVSLGDKILKAQREADLPFAVAKVLYEARHELRSYEGTAMDSSVDGASVMPDAKPMEDTEVHAAWAVLHQVVGDSFDSWVDFCERHGREAQIIAFDMAIGRARRGSFKGTGSHVKFIPAAEEQQKTAPMH